MTTRKIRITTEAALAIRATARGEFNDTSVPDGPGFVRVKFGDEVIGGIARLAFKGESISDTIIRLCTVVGKQPN